jgi:hypothetical protein
VQVLAPELAHDARAKIGQVFGVIRATTEPRNGDALTALLEDALTRVVAEVMMRSAGLPREPLIEIILQKLNNALDFVFGERGLPIDRGSISSTLVFLQGSSFIASFWGKSNAYLVRMGEQSRIFSFGSQSESHDVSLSYSEVVSGVVGQKDRLMLATSDISSVVDRETIVKTVSSYRSDAAVVALGDCFGAVSPAPLAILLAGEAAYTPVGFGAGSVEAQKNSLEGLLHTASRTNDILSPPLLKPLTSKLGSSVSKAFSKISQTTNSLFAGSASKTRASFAPAEELIQEDIETPAVTASISVDTTQARAMFDRAFKVVSALKNTQERKAIVTGVTSAIPRFVGGLSPWFNGLNEKKKTVVAGLMTVCVVFNVAMMGILSHRRTQAKILAYEKQLQTISQKIDAAESSLIYNDFSRAKTLLDESGTLVAMLPSKTPDEQSARAALTKRLDEQRQTMRRESSLPTPAVTAALPETATGTISTLALKDTALFTATSAGELYSTSLKDGFVRKIGEAIGAGPTFLLPLSNGLLYGGDDGVVRFVSDTGTVVAKAPLEGLSDLKVTDAVFYGTALYVLDAQHNRIAKYPVGTKTFGRAQLSVKDGTDIAAGTSLSIDGSIYVLQANGAITKIKQGIHENYTLQPVDPAPTHAAGLIVSSTTDNLYFFDNDRLLSYSKNTGRFVGQYQLGVAGNRGVFDEKGKKLYVINGRNVSVFPVP